jgi:SAM-dependent methyltransferase
MNSVKYRHDETAHNIQDPGIIVPVIMEVLNPESVVDVGCGIGTFLQVFEENGVKKILGLDGQWVDKSLLSRHINIENFKVIDIESGFETEEKFDLAICLEVLEHVNSVYADNTVKSLTLLSDIIVFSAAIPGQMGQNHVNEQWPQYWIEKFGKHDFSFHDVFRPIFWNNKGLARWYKQNMFLVVKNGHEFNLKGFKKFQDSGMKALVHPEYFDLRVRELSETLENKELLNRELERIMKGKAPFKTYLKLISKYFRSKLY